jgi:hypothetical protein
VSRRFGADRERERERERERQTGGVVLIVALTDKTQHLQL